MEIVKTSLSETYPPSLYLTLHNIWGDGFMVVEDGGRIVAFVAAVESERHIARVLMLAVLREYRGRSLGSMLMKELYTRCVSNGIHTVKLEVRKSNKVAMTFYEGQGFSVTGELKNFYIDGEGAFVMTKILES
ncbi:MAG: GNAT family N-acetyltransferase [Methanobacteriota archaeon]|nr:MAG: GNAT family N-acetyltransferase [Euryarchaeota archaeon]